MRSVPHRKSMMCDVDLEKRQMKPSYRPGTLRINKARPRKNVPLRYPHVTLPSTFFLLPQPVCSSLPTTAPPHTLGSAWSSLLQIPRNQIATVYWLPANCTTYLIPWLALSHFGPLPLLVILCRLHVVVSLFLSSFQPHDSAREQNFGVRPPARSDLLVKRHVGNRCARLARLGQG